MDWYYGWVWGGGTKRVHDVREGIAENELYFRRPAADQNGHAHHIHLPP